MAIALPPVVGEGKYHPFKFWFNNHIQDGMYYRNELFYRFYTADPNCRARLYHYACKLAEKNDVVVTGSSKEYSIWISLRSPDTVYLALGQSALHKMLPLSSQKRENEDVL